MGHSDCTMKKAALTIRLPASLKGRLQARAESQPRSISAQVVADLERVADELETSSSAVGGRFLGRFAGTAMPTDDDLAEVRSLLWRRIGHHEQRP
jgi:predicted transcriptional regulator